MADEQQYTPAEFAAVMRQMHPEFADEKDDDALTGAVLKLHPEFQDHVRMGPPPPRVGTPPPPMPSLGKATGIGPDPGGRPIQPVGQESGFEAGFQRLKRGVVNAISAFGAAGTGGVGHGDVMAPRPVSPTLRTEGGATPANQLARSATDIVGGGMQTGEPAIALAAALNPLETAAAMGVGTVIKEGVHSLLTRKRTPWQASHRFAGQVGGDDPNQPMASPHMADLVSDVASLVGGAKVGAQFHEPLSSTPRPRSIAAEGRFQDNVYDVGNRSLDASRVNQLTVEGKAAVDAESLRRAEVFHKQQEEIKKLHARIAINAGLNEIAKNAKASAGTGVEPFDYLGKTGRVTDTARQIMAGTLPPDPLMLAENAGPGGSETRPSIIGAPSGMPVESVGVRNPTIAQVSPEPPPVVPETPPAPYTERLGLQGVPPIDPQLQESVDSFSRVPPVEPTPAAAPPSNLLPERTRTGQQPIVGAQPGQPLEVVGSAPPTVSQPSAEFPELIQTAGEQVASELESRRPGPPRPSEGTRVKMRDRAEYQSAHKEAAGELADEMESKGHEKGRQITDTRTGETYYQPPTPGSGVYWDLIPPTEAKRPGISRTEMTDLIRVYAETGARNARDIPPDYRPNFKSYQMDVDGAGDASLSLKFRNAYNKYVEGIRRQADRRARQTLAMRARMAASEAEGLPAGSEPGPPGAGEPGGEVGPPPAPSRLASTEPELPDWAMSGDEPDLSVTEAIDTDLESPAGVGAPPPSPTADQPPTATFIGYQPTMGGSEVSGLSSFEPLYNITGGPRDRSTVMRSTLEAEGIQVPETPPIEDWKASRRAGGGRPPSAEPAVGSPPPSVEAAPAAPEPKGQRSLFDRLKGQEGHLILDVRPGDKAGLQQWLVKAEREHGDQLWFQDARRALDADNVDEAYRIAATAAGRSFLAATGGNAAKAAERREIPTRMPGEPPPISPEQSQALKIAGMDLKASPEELAALQERLFPGSTPEPGGPPPSTGTPVEPKRFLLDEFMREEGHLILDVDPNDRAGFKRWMKKNEAEHGSEDWYQKATSALEGGDYPAARKIAEVASARVSMGTLGVGGRRIAASTEGPVPVKELEKLTGQTLPKGTTIDHGIVKLPGNPGGLDPKVTDMLLGRTFTQTLVDLADPNTIVRIVDENGKVPSDLPKSLQMANQMADQFLRETPAELIEPMMDDLGITRAQLAAHFARKISDAGRNLGMVGNWVQANEEMFIRLDPDMPSTKGPGAAGRMEFVPEARAEVIANYMDILRRKGLTTSLQEKLADAGYEPPKGVDPASKPAQLHARAWLRTRQKAITAGKIVDQVARKYNDTDTVMAAMGEVPPVGRALEDASQFSLATMLAQASTAMNVFAGQVTRYGMGSMEEALSGVSARLRGDTAGSVKHFATAKRLATTPFNQLDYLPKGMLHSPASENLNTIFDYTRTADPNSVHMFLQALDKFPQEQGRLRGMRMMGDVEKAGGAEPEMTTMQKVRNLLTVGIRAQEMPMRTVVGDAVLRSLIKAKGDDPLTVLGSPEGLIGKYGEAEARNMIGASISQALNYTFAGNPLPESPIGRVLGLMHDVPGLAPVIRTVRPFVRFSMATVPRFVWDRMSGLTLPIDLAMHHVWKTGRLSRGLQLDALQRGGGILDTTQTELATAKFRAADTLNDSMAAMLEARQAKQALAKMEKRGENTAALPDDVQAKVDELKATYEAATETANTKRAEHLAARQEATDLSGMFEKRLTRANQLREIDAPNFDQYVARQTTGAMLMALAFGIRALESNEGTKYYQHRQDDDSTPMDLRSVIPGFAVYLHTADFFHDLMGHTDWDVLKETKDLSKAYTGKYQGAETLAAAMDDWFNVSYLTGMPGIIADLATGKTPEALSETSAQSMRDISLQWLGEQLGRFTTGFETAKDVAGVFSEEENKRRTPERTGPNTPAWRSVFGPAMAHIPGVSEMLPERVSPFTGEAIKKPHPGVHQATGASFTEKLTPAEEEINRTGLSYSKAVPKVTGDQEFDNAVNKAFGGLLKEYFPEVLADEEYKKLTPELKRDVLEHIFQSFKQGAYATVADSLGEETAQQTLMAPGVKARRERWMRFLGELQEKPSPLQSEPEPADQGAGGFPPYPAAAPAVGAPPPAAP